MTDTALDALIAVHPEYDAEEVQAAYWTMDNPESHPRPYLPAERQAHELLLAYLQHFGTVDWDGQPGEGSVLSLVNLFQKMGLARMELDDGKQGVGVVLPIEILYELLADFMLLANTVAHHNGEGNASALMTRLAKERALDELVRTAWLNAHD